MKPVRRVELRRGAGAEKRLLDVARRLFAARGFAGISVRELTRTAEVSRPVLYYHCGSKEGLFLAALRKAATDYENSLTRAAGGAGSVRERIRRVCGAHAAAGYGRALLASTAGNLPGSSPRPSAARVVEIVRGLVGEGIESHEFAACDPGDAALALVGVAEGAIAHLPSGSSGPRTSDLLDRALSVVLRGLTPGPRRSRYVAAPHRRRR